MGVLKSVLLKGTISQTLTYPLTLTEEVRDGEWEIALNNVSFLYHTKEAHPAPIPKNILKITSNYHGQKSTIGFRNRDFYTINNVEQNLIIKFDTIDTNEFTTGAEVFLLVVLKRVR